MATAPYCPRNENGASVFGEDGWRREAFLNAGRIVEVLLAGHVHLGPGCGTDADNPAGADAFDDEVGLEANLDAAAAERRRAGRPGDIEDGPSRGHVRGA